MNIKYHDDHPHGSCLSLLLCVLMMMMMMCRAESRIIVLRKEPNHHLAIALLKTPFPISYLYYWNQNSIIVISLFLNFIAQSVHTMLQSLRTKIQE